MWLLLEDIGAGSRDAVGKDMAADDSCPPCCPRLLVLLVSLYIVIVIDASPTLLEVSVRAGTSSSCLFSCRILTDMLFSSCSIIKPGKSKVFQKISYCSHQIAYRHEVVKKGRAISNPLGSEVFALIGNFSCHCTEALLRYQYYS